MKTVKNILWDFDGVILDSMPIRDKGFELVFTDFPKEQVNLLLNYHRENGGLSRYVKIRYFFEEILKHNISEEEVNHYANNFSSIMKIELNSPALLIEDTVSFIRENSMRYNMHIVSGSDQTELNILCKLLGISDYFISILGSPTPKKELVRTLLTDCNYNIDETILIGDSHNDFDAANVNNIRFYGYNNIDLKQYSSYYINCFKEGNLF